MKRDFVYIREVDRLGRFVIPKEMRKAYDMDVGARVVITPTENGIILCSLGDAKEQASEYMLEAIEEREKNRVV